MTIPDYQTLMRPVLVAASRGEIGIRDCIAQLSDDLRLTDDERQTLLPSGKQTLMANRTHWAKSYLVKAGLLEMTRRGHFKITPRGIEILSRNPVRVDNSVLADFQEFLDFVKVDPKLEIASPPQNSILKSPPVPSVPPISLSAQATPIEAMSESHEQIVKALAQELLELILAATPAFFERIVVDLLVAMGYGGSREDAGRAIGKSGDGGIDGIIDQDPLGLDRVYIQAKRYQLETKIGRPEIQSFAGSLEGVQATKGVFFTTSSFAAPAKEYVSKITKRIILIDGVMLTSLMIRHNVGIRVEQIFEVKKVDEDYFVT